MQNNNSDDPIDLNAYRINSRREIGTILRSIQDHRQLVRLAIRGGSHSVLTSLLQVDMDGDNIVVDCVVDAGLNRKILEASPVQFETTLDNITISFEAEHVEECLFDEKLAFVFSAPKTLIRLQRREYYRIETPRINPVQCTIHVPGNAEVTSLTFPLENVSGGGVAIIDEHFRLDATIGRIYEDCRIALPHNTFLVVKLQIRNVRNVTLQNGKAVRQVGCLFVELPRPMLNAVQRYITMLEREQSAKNPGN